ncbi:MAG TPA: hypothetical protein VGI96_49835 [Streptosporangiaceae bacterium]
MDTTRGTTPSSRRRRLSRPATAGLVVTIAAAAMAAPAAAAALAASPASPASPAATAHRGQLVSATPLRTLEDRAAVTARLRADGFNPGTDRYGVRTYRLVYRTVDAHGRPTAASGLLALPIGGPRNLPVVSFTHGTEVFRGDAPSEQPTGFEPGPAYTYASAGFAVSDPDYLGLGTGPGLHPWMDVPSETTAALDMLRASRSYVTSHGRTLRHQVLATGFSQGASAALGLGRALQGGADPWFRLGALAPVSGAYDFGGASVSSVLDGELIRLNPNPQLGARIAVLYTAWMLVGFNRVHPIAGIPGAIVKAPYTSTIEGLFDGRHTGDQVIGSLPATVDGLLTPYGLYLLRHPAGGFAAALRSADSVCQRWSPKTPIRLYYASHDEQAVNANTVHCQAWFAAQGLRVPAVNLGTPDYQGSRHLGSNVAGTARIARWFLALSR